LGSQVSDACAPDANWLTPAATVIKTVRAMAPSHHSLFIGIVSLKRGDCPA
jgi:hypothetical protein